MDLTMARRSIVALRGFLGIGSLLTPRLMATLFGVDPTANPVAPYVLRLFGARELLMAWQVHSAEDDQLEKIFTDAIPVDGADVLAAVAGGAAGYMPKRAAVMAALSASAGVAHGVFSRGLAAGARR